MSNAFSTLPFQSIAVLAAQLVLYALLPLWALRLPLRSPAGWARSLILALATQVVIGLIVGWSIPQAQRWVPWLYVAGWVGVRLRSSHAREPSREPDGSDPLLLLLLALAVFIRWIHPWQTWALGQSDAYAHLMFINDVVHGGRLSNPIYPPGFAWIMALPSLVFGLDPYTVARFGGAFHGAGLVLALYVLVHAWAGRTGARIAAAVVTGFPLAWVLTKTGVGAFANQVGLLALPIGWWAVGQWWSAGPARATSVTLAAVFLLLGVATPMMLIQFCLLLGIAGAVVIAQEHGKWKSAIQLALLAIPGFLLFLAHLFYAGGVARGQTSAYLVGEEVSGPINIEDADPSMDIERDHVSGLLTDFLRIKRGGFGSWVLNIPAFAVFAAFACACAIGWRRGRVSMILLGVWGAVTTVQTATGVLQLSFYQREGWSLMIAAISFGGVAIEELLRRSSFAPMRGIVVAMGVAGALSGLVFPPAHRLFASPAENEMIAFIRAVNGDRVARRLWPGPATDWSVFDRASRVHLVVRPISGFSNRIGDPVHALATGRLHARDRAVAPAPGELTIGLLDASDERPVSAGFIMRVLQPGLTDEFIKRRNEAARESAELEADLRALQLPVQERVLSPRLRALLIFPSEARDP